MAPPPGRDPPRRRPELAAWPEQPVPALGQPSEASQLDAWTAAEVDVARELVSWRRQFVTKDRRVDTSSERGHLVVTNYLQCLDVAFEVFRVEAASRRYRDSFTPKYRTLWPGRSRQLRVDVVEASVQQVIYMNGHAYKLGPTAEHLAGYMRHEWAELGELLKRLYEEELAGRSWAAGFKVDLRRALGALDGAWASFERAYVTEAMAIEEQALALLAQACEQALHAADGQPESAAACQKQLGELVRLLHMLSAVACAGVVRPANWHLDARVLLEAKTILAAVGPPTPGEDRQTVDPARIIAARAIGAFEAVRDYLCGVTHSWERVDGELANNVGLVAQLTRWQDDISPAVRYLISPDLCQALRCVAACVCAAQTAAPPLAAMIAVYDADLFLVLPRIALLGFLALPDRIGPLIEHVLPEAFPESGLRGPELQALVRTYGHAIELIVGAMGDDDGVDAERPAPVDAAGGSRLADEVARRRAFDALVQRAVLGRGRRPGALLGGLPARVSSALARRAAEALLRELEGWSMRLQRQRPEVWNELSAVLARCLSEGARGGGGGGPGPPAR